MNTEETTVPVNIQVFNGEELLAECECDVMAKIETIDDSFDWEGGIREESHQEVINDQEMVIEIERNTKYKYHMFYLKTLIDRIVWLAVQEYACTSDTNIYIEVDIIDFLKTEEI